MSRELNVYLYGKIIGVLSEDELLQLSFQYCDQNAKPLSVILPVREERYPHAYAFAFFENLIPEGEAFKLLTLNRVSGNKIFTILDKFGGDCAGAVAFYKSTPVNNINETLQEISSAKIAHIIDKLPEDPLLTSLENPPRFSLAGAQSKFAIHKIDNQYYRSDNNYPTTHIIKITNKRFPDLLKNEFFCMRLAQSIQPDIPNVKFYQIENRPYLEIERYDRYKKNGIVNRIHQEDFCQALGLTSEKKYQFGGGPSLRDSCRVIEEFSNNSLTDINKLIEWTLFNFFIGNVDAHAKNISLLYTDSGIKLAPFYDLLSIELYSRKVVDHSIAMLINGKGKYEAVSKNDFIALFEQLGVNATNTMRLVKDKFANIIKTAEILRDELNSDELTKCDVYDLIIDIIRKRMKSLGEI